MKMVLRILKKKMAARMNMRILMSVNMYLMETMKWATIN